jgi:hypothetical protein
MPGRLFKTPERSKNPPRNLLQGGFLLCTIGLDGLGGALFGE